MAIYQESKYVTVFKHIAFDALHAAGSRAPHSGVYRCEGCGVNEVAISGHPLPAQSHHRHSGLQEGSIRWRLIVATS
ncbi:hypothetical protein [Caballeronia sp. CLC5]|uniref:hypothetical protein n=1 Tax=Caballeronia sp. CLC5 TaxID=2906764 RepID=UPI001F40122B|nr:hypothetical protein [Caballeronia sp. CLC5]MCE4570283.1 hypothetical protein [Caballeronia sp. CLC5]